MLSTLRFAARQLIRARTATVVIVCTLALGMGANVSMFALVDAVLLRRPPARKPDRLAWITAVREHDRSPQNISYPDYRDVRASARSFGDVFGYTRASLSIGGDAPERVRGEVVTGNYFTVLGTRPQQGRLLDARDDGAPGTNFVAVISDGFWRRRFGANPRVVDSTITINGQVFTIVGVAPPGFDGIEIDDAPQSLWLPMSMVATADPVELRGALDNRTSRGWLRVIGRLAPDATIERANVELRVIAARLQDLHRSDGQSFALSSSPVLGGTDPSNRAQIAPIMELLVLVPALVLLVACANAANVLLARGFARRRELAVRRALGASRMRIVGQLLTESTVTALLAAGAGVLVSFWFTALIARVGAVPPSIVATLTPAPRVLVWTGVLACATGILFGLVPALAATGVALAPALKVDEPTVVLGRRRFRLRNLLLTGQVAVSLTLLVTAGLFIGSLGKALHADPGFTSGRGAVVSFDLARQGYDSVRRTAFEHQFVAGVRALPGVEAAALASEVPFGGHYNGTDFATTATTDPNNRPSGFISSVSPGYFGTLGISLVRGREFTDHDDASAGRVVVVNEMLAHRLWPDVDPLGKELRVRDTVYEVIGVARSGKYASLTESPRAYAYFPQAQRPSLGGMTLVVRTTGEPAGVTPAIRAVANTLDHDLPLYGITTLADLKRGAADLQQASASMLAVFGVLALILAGLGMYGVTAHMVSMRRREIGIRMSLGARAQDVLRMFVRDGITRSGAGVLVGLLVSAVATKLLAGFLFGLAPADAATFVGAASSSSASWPRSGVTFPHGAPHASIR